ncbi:hypothetical protein KDL01_24170 [Actinospica durhamensis]|uniref:Uncharacterized protein n=1 Tax=Actinospica durhamensis TaxID=1508375 RepID=A0A941IV36_9ACTN|nr:hypothetical protein [Actinospica durhamensis]MBR7836396.1 hypothetical protein [Actinospica durhamensis]
MTRLGLECADGYAGDALTFGEARRRPPEHRSFTASDGGIINVESSIMGLQVGKIERIDVDVASLVRFAQAVAEALPGLPVPPPDKSTASASAAEILQESTKASPDHSKLKALGGALRTIVEGAANGVGSALATALLGMWHP